MIQKKLNTAKDLKAIERLTISDYRDAYLEAQVRTWIAYQIRALRKKARLSQTEMAERLRKPQSVVSRLEDENYGRLSVTTLLEVAKAMDVSLLIQFVSYPDFLDRTQDKSERAMQPDTIHESAEILRRRETMLSYQRESWPDISRKNNTNSALKARAAYIQEPPLGQILSSQPSRDLQHLGQMQ